MGRDYCIRNGHENTTGSGIKNNGPQNCARGSDKSISKSASGQDYWQGHSDSSLSNVTVNAASGAELSEHEVNATGSSYDDA